MAQVVPHPNDSGSEIDVVDGGELGIDYDDDIEEDVNYRLAMAKKNFLIRDLTAFYESLTYENMKQAMEYFLITATFSISFTVSIHNCILNLFCSYLKLKCR